MTKTSSPIPLADEVWLIVASMHRNQPQREGFTPSEIQAEIKRVNLTGKLRQGIPTHISSRLVANVKPNPGFHRMLYRLPGGEIRLYRPGDSAHPDRHGKMTPDRNRLPRKYRPYLDWYEKTYCAQPTAAAPNQSFIDRLTGLGKTVWMSTSADVYVAGLRKGWES